MRKRVKSRHRDSEYVIIPEWVCEGGYSGLRSSRLGYEAGSEELENMSEPL